MDVLFRESGARTAVSPLHGEKILSFLRPGGRMLQWGAGATTLWIADRLPSGATLTTIEHEPEFYDTVVAALGSRPNVQVRLRPAEGPLGRVGTRDEEDATSLASYVQAAGPGRFDVILVEGMARGACLAAARTLLNPDGVVFLRDSQRPWYDAAKRNYRCWRVVGATSDEDSSVLWLGGAEPFSPSAPDADLPVIVTYYTKDTSYEDEAREMIESCERFGLEYDVTALPVLDSWDASVAKKAEVCVDAWHRLRRPILWVDADARMHARPTLLAGCRADLGIHRWNDVTVCGGTLFFNQTALGQRVLERWAERCRREPHVLDQVSLDLAWEEVTARHPLDTLWLPRAYCQIFDGAPDPDMPPVIVHGQASRRYRHVTFKKPSRPYAQPSEAISRAREASRPRLRSFAPVASHAFEQDRREEGLLDFVLPGYVPLGPGAVTPGIETIGWWNNTTHTPAERVTSEQLALEECLREIEAELSACREVIVEQHLGELVARLRGAAPEPFAIYGAGAIGQALCRAAQRAGLTPAAFVESQPDRHGQILLGVPIMSPSACRASRCHRYAIGSFGSTTSMKAALAEVYADGGDSHDVLAPAEPLPRLPDRQSAAKTLLLLQQGLLEGRSITETWK